MAGETPGRAGRLVLFLLVANGVLSALFLGIWYWGERDRGLPEFNADKIRLLEQPPARARPSPPVDATAAPGIETPLAEQVPTTLCYKVETMDQARYQTFRDILAKLEIASGAYRLIADNKFSWWVYWPPEYEAAQRDAVLKKFALARVRDVLPIAKGPMAQSFSLGMFPEEAPARAHRDRLRQKGLDKAEYGIRPGIGPFGIRVKLDSPARTQALKAMLPAWAEAVDDSACEK